MGDDFFEGGAEAVGPIGGEESAGVVDPFFFGVERDEFGEEGEVFLEQVDVEEARCVMDGVEDVETLFLGEDGVVAPSHELGEGD